MTTTNRSKIWLLLVPLVLFDLYAGSMFFAVAADASEQDRADFFMAIERGRVQDVARYLKSGLSVDVTNEKGMSPLVFLVSVSPYKGTPKQQVDIARLLIAHGADVNRIIPPSVNPSQVPVLVWAIFTGNVDLVRLFLASGADPNITNAKPLFSAVSSGKRKTVELLLKQGANVDARDESGQTPLFLVDDPGIAGVLIKAGADVNALNADGVSALKYLTDPNKGCGNWDCIPVNEQVLKLLRSRGAKLEP